MADREFLHPRILLERLDTAELRDLADHLAHQLAATELTRERETRPGHPGLDHSLVKDRAYSIIVGSIAPRLGS